MKDDARVTCYSCSRPPVEGLKHCFVCLERSKSSQWYYSKIRVQRALSQGLCGTCCKNPQKPGCKSCCECIDKFAAQTRHNYWKSVKMGLCVMCHREPPVDGVRMCPTCLEKQRAFSNKSRKNLRPKRIADRICVQCGKAPAAEGTQDCESCRIKRSMALTSDWKPGAFGRPAPLWATPEQKLEHRRINRERHKEYVKQRKAEKVAQGICLRCDQPSRPGHQCCEVCAAKCSQQTMEGQRAKVALRPPRPCRKCGAPTGRFWDCDDCIRKAQAVKTLVCADCKKEFRKHGNAARCPACREKHRARARQCVCGTELKRYQHLCTKCRERKLHGVRPEQQ